MRFTLRDNLPFVTVTLAYRGAVVTVPHVLIDTGSARTILAVDMLASIQVEPAPNDVLYTIRGIGGREAVFSRLVDYVQVGERKLPQFEIEVGGMDYGFLINGILGMDYLRQAGAILNFTGVISSADTSFGAVNRVNISTKGIFREKILRSRTWQKAGRLH